MIITDEMVEKAQEAYISTYPLGAVRDDLRDMRAALEAVAPMLQKALTDADICRAKAQGLREAVEITYAASIAWDDTTRMIAHAIEARTRELDPQ